MKKLCPFTKEFQMLKYNLTEEEAIFKIRSFKNTCIEYWLVRGFSEEKAKEKIKEIQISRNKKAVLAKQENPDKAISNTSLTYYLNKGMTEKEAKHALSERQSTFSLEKCIKKYGEEEGLKRFNARQEKWQNTLNNKSDEEKEEINKKRSAKYTYILKYRGKRRYKKIY